MKPGAVTFARNPFRVSGFRRRSAALIAAVAFSACTAGWLNAAVIDDFEGRVKFAKGGGGTNYFRWGLTNGQMVVYTNTPSTALRYDNVYWPNSMPGVSLEGGRTLELRVDLNHTSTDDLFLLLMCACPGDDVYGVFVDQNEVALCKYRPAVQFTTFYWDTLATTNENVTVKLAFTQTNSSLAITVKIVDKGNQRGTLYERTFVDGPGQDGPVPPPDPHGIGGFTPDAGGPYTNFTFAAAGCMRVVCTTAPPLEMLLDNLEYDVYYPPHLEIAPGTNAVALNWLLPKEEHIVVQATNLAGPWSPCAQPHTRTGDAFCLQTPCDCSQKFFKLTPGKQFTDDFSTLVPTWTPWFQEAGKEWMVVNGALQVSLAGQPDHGGLALCPLGATNSGAVLRDFCVSVDTLHWVTSGTNWSTLGLFGRGSIISTNYGTAFFGGIGLNYGGIPGRITPWIAMGSVETHDPSFDMADYPPPYRLQFSGVGNKMSLRVFSLTTGQLIHEMPFKSWVFPTGIVGLWFNGRNEAGDSYTNIVDNFFMSGTKP